MLLQRIWCSEIRLHFITSCFLLRYRTRVLQTKRAWWKSRLIDSCSTADATSRFLYREQQTPCSCTDNNTVNKRVSQSLTGLKASRCHDRSQTPSAMSPQSDQGAAVLRALRPSRFSRNLSVTLRADADLSFCLSVNQVKCCRVTQTQERSSAVSEQTLKETDTLWWFSVGLLRSESPPHAEPRSFNLVVVDDVWERPLRRVDDASLQPPELLALSRLLYRHFARREDERFHLCAALLISWDFSLQRLRRKTGSEALSYVVTEENEWKTRLTWVLWSSEGSDRNTNQTNSQWLIPQIKLQTGFDSSCFLQNIILWGDCSLSDPLQ